MKLALTCGTTNITNRISSISKVAQFEENRIIGNCPSSEYSVELNNEDGFFTKEILSQEFTCYVDNQDVVVSNEEVDQEDDTLQELIDNQEIIKNDNLFDVLTCYETPEDMSNGKLSLTLYDNMSKLNIPFDTDVNSYPKTLYSVVAEIENMCGVYIRQPLDNNILNLTVSSFDSSYTCRQVLGFICELMGCYAIANRYGTIQIMNFGNEVSVESDDYVYELKVSKEVSYGKVVYDNGLIRDWSTNNPDNVQEPSDVEALYISQDNLYYGDYVGTSRQDLINSTASVLLTDSTFSDVVPIDNFKGRYINGTQLGYTLNYDGYFKSIITKYSIEFINGAMAHATMEVNSNLKSKNIDNATTGVETSVSKRLNVRINAVEQQLELISSGGAGNNLIKDSMGVFYSIFDENARVWKYNGTLEDVVLYATNSSVASINQYGYALSVPYGTISQSVVLPIGTYTLSFAYTSPIGEESYDIYGNVMLDGELVTTFGLQQTNEFQEIETSFAVIGQARTMELSFYNGMVNGQVLVANLMLNVGDGKKDWSLANDETFDEYVKIGRGIEIGDTTSEVKFKATSNIIGFTRGDEFVSTFNQDGMETNGVKVKDNANLLGLGVSRLNNQVVFYIDETWGV